LFKTVEKIELNGKKLENLILILSYTRLIGFSMSPH